MIQEANGFNKSIGQKIKDARLKAKLTQTKLAKHCDITFQQVQKYEKGVNGCSAFRLNQISKKLKVPITYFFVDNFNSIARFEIQQLDKNGKLKPNRTLTVSILDPIDPNMNSDEFLDLLQKNIYEEIEKII